MSVRRLGWSAFALSGPLTTTTTTVITEKSVYMKISSDTKTIGFYYSLDKKTWQLIRLFKNDYPASIWVGISTQSPLGEGTSAVFEEISLTGRSISDFRLGI